MEPVRNITKVRDSKPFLILFPQKDSVIVERKPTISMGKCSKDISKIWYKLSTLRLIFYRERLEKAARFGVGSFYNRSVQKCGHVQLQGLNTSTDPSSRSPGACVMGTNEKNYGVEKG